MLSFRKAAAAIRHRLSCLYGKYLHHFRHWEHYGFVAYAACEVFHAERIIYAVSVSLFGTGVVVMVAEVFVFEEAKAEARREADDAASD